MISGNWISWCNWHNSRLEIFIVISSNKIETIEILENHKFSNLEQVTTNRIGSPVEFINC